MREQAKAFLEGEGEAWLKRNKDKLGPVSDPVLSAMLKYNLKPKSVLEIGCSNGWRLEIIEREWLCHVEGVDPMVRTFREPTLVQVWDGTADNLLYCSADQYDTVIYGWCLYLCDPEDYFKIVSESDRVLKDSGFIIIYDFIADHPYKNKYKHKEGLFSHKMDFAKLWLGHPAYSLYGRSVYGAGDNQTAVTILKKSMNRAFPEIT